MRTEYCGKISKKYINKQVSLCGWVTKIKNFGHFLFFYFEDIKGEIQIILKENYKKNVHKIKNGFCLNIVGIVKNRSTKNINKNIPLGDIEIHIKKIKILSKSKEMPIDILQRNKSKRTLKYRYLDLRTKKIQKNLLIRSKVILIIHKFMQKKDFIHIETPIITKSTPEGARDYIIPSRNHIGKFYALPQSPQIFKQLIMISRFDKYYQIAKCFRDEDLRTNRQPEFTQIDIELSFSNEKKIKKIIESLIYTIWKKVCKIKLKNFPEITYKESIKKYGTDSPDIRNPLEITDFTKFFTHSKIKEKILNRKILGIHISYKIKLNLNCIKKYIELIKSYNIKNVLYIVVSKKKINKIKISKNITLDKTIFKNIIIHMKLLENDIIILSNSKNDKIYKIFGIILKKIATDYNLINKNSYKPIWIKEFPMFKKDKKGNLTSVHHPFTSPKENSIKKIQKNPEAIFSRSYDLVINGKEIGGGSVRIHNVKTQKLIFKILNFSKKNQKRKFGFFLDALQYGPPPHSGIALGLDRIIMMLTKSSDIKDVIAFPKTASAACKTTNAPDKISNKFLKDLHIKIEKYK
ncbi:aspartate--tRNA ligase [Buchnera aphidicola (Chaitoregma tattakana)]|uniref:aspartate--tRNA ligase n=1 Tax=Buchnera aphidicola TaxID=9 RepID=UPI0031B850D5